MKNVNIFLKTTPLKKIFYNACIKHVTTDYPSRSPPQTGAQTGRIQCHHSVPTHTAFFSGPFNTPLLFVPPLSKIYSRQEPSSFQVKTCLSVFFIRRRYWACALRVNLYCTALYVLFEGVSLGIFLNAMTLFEKNNNLQKACHLSDSPFKRCLLFFQKLQPLEPICDVLIRHSLFLAPKAIIREECVEGV